MKRLYATVDPDEARQLRALLKDQGIETTLEDDGGIHVRDEDAPAAAEALARHFENKDPESRGPDLALLEERSQRRYFRRRFVILLTIFFPAVLGFAISFDEPWQMALAGAAGVLALVALIWALDLIAESRKEDDPT